MRVEARAEPAERGERAAGGTDGVIRAAQLPKPHAARVTGIEEWGEARDAARVRFDGGEADIRDVRDAPRRPRIADAEESFAELTVARNDRRSADLFAAQMGAYRAEVAVARSAENSIDEEPMFGAVRRRV